VIAASLFLCASLPAIVSEPPAGAVKLLRPGTRADTSQQASTSRAPWVDANGWRYRRQPDKTFLYDGVSKARLPLAAAEAFAYGGRAAIRAEGPDAEALKPMLEFLASIEDSPLPPVADFLLIDDGSPMLGEIMNLLSRRNLLFTTKADNREQHKLVVEVGSPEFPRASAANPAEFSNRVRQILADSNRSLRIYGAETVIGHLLSDGKRARLHLLNYGSDPVEMFRVRTKGTWKIGRVRSYGQPDASVDEIEHYAGGTEFSVPVLSVYAVIDFEASEALRQ
jgi:hypothetical protein